MNPLKRYGFVGSGKGKGSGPGGKPLGLGDF